METKRIENLPSDLKSNQNKFEQDNGYENANNISPSEVAKVEDVNAASMENSVVVEPQQGMFTELQAINQPPVEDRAEIIEDALIAHNELDHTENAFKVLENILKR